MPEFLPSLEEADAAMARGLRRNASSTNYLCWIADLISPYMGANVLEVGAGLGDVTAVIADGTRHVHATEISPMSFASLSRRFENRSDVSVSIDDVVSRPLPEKYDSAYLSNVLEHIEDDRLALSNIFDSVRPGGAVAVYVPAFMLLYSPWDREIGHYRRYRLSDLECLMTAVGAKSVDSRYVNFVGGIGWLTYCRLLKRPASDDVSVSLFDRVVVPTMRIIEDRVAPPFGISALVVGRRP
jgi:SAM-dependent methyltransferase